MKKSTFLLLVFIIFTAFTQHREITWMAIGDSITFMNGKPELSKNRMSKGYMDDVVEKLPYVHFVNNGHSGWTAKGIADNIDNLNIVKSDVYSVFLGTNDWWVCLPIGTFSDYENNTGSKTVYGSYRIIIDKIRSLNSDAMIILITPLQRTDFIDINNQTTFIHGDYAPNKSGDNLSQYADAIKAIAKAEHCKLVDLYYKSGITTKNAVKYSRLRDPQTKEYKNYTYPGYIKIPYSATDDYPYPVEATGWVYDGLHPSDAGHKRIAEMLIKVIKKY